MSTAASRSAAARVRAHRERLKLGRALLVIDIDVGAVADMLVAGGLLAEWDSEDREAIARALERLVELLCWRNALQD